MIQFSSTKSIEGRDYVPLDEVLAYIEGLKEHQNLVKAAVDSYKVVAEKKSKNLIMG